MPKKKVAGGAAEGVSVAEKKGGLRRTNSSKSFPLARKEGGGGQNSARMEGQKRKCRGGEKKFGRGRRASRRKQSRRSEKKSTSGRSRRAYTSLNNNTTEEEKPTSERKREGLLRLHGKKETPISEGGKTKKKERPSQRARLGTVNCKPYMVPEEKMKESGRTSSCSPAQKHLRIRGKKRREREARQRSRPLLPSRKRGRRAIQNRKDCNQKNKKGINGDLQHKVGLRCTTSKERLLSRQGMGSKKRGPASIQEKIKKNSILTH